MNPLLLQAMNNPMFRSEVNRLTRKLQNMKPDYYKIDIPKSERKGKTQEELMEMRMERYLQMKGKKDD